MEHTLTIGRLVHFVLNAGPNRGSHRPALVVGLKPGEVVDLQVFSDGTRSAGDCLPNVFWRRDTPHGPNGPVGTWHWPEEVVT